EQGEREFLIVWTTTPWTLPYNLAVMVNPNIEYVRARVGNEVWIIAKALATSVIKGLMNKNFEAIQEFKGSELRGLRYKHPFYFEIKYQQDLKKKNPRAHTIVLAEEYVNTSSGSGLVHCAPGCGPEDYEIGHRLKLPPYNTVDENGELKGVGKFSGYKARKDDFRFILSLEEKGLLLKRVKVKHDYPHCWRCNSAVIFRATRQWFFSIESGLKEKMLEENRKVKWQPDWAGSRWMNSWLENLRDNGITRQIVWGIPLPIWKCERCEKFIVVGSAKELKRLSKVKIPEDLHRPYIDKITIKCTCEGIMHRIPDVLDVWVDAGSNSFTCLDFPQKKDLFRKLFPADLIIEGKDQIRGWFNLLLVVGMIAFEKHPYKAVYMHGFINDSLGRKMSKSLGNIISPDEVVNKYGADAMRFYMLGGTSPGLDLNYNLKDIETRHRNLAILYNVTNYLLEYSENLNVKPKLKSQVFGIEEEYIISRMHSTLSEVNNLFEELQFNKIPSLLENLFLDLSRFYIQVTRDKVFEEPEIVINTIYKVLYNSVLMLAPITPYLAEEIYQKLKKFSGPELKAKSVHLCKWPEIDAKLINKKLEENVELVREVIEGALAERENVGIGLRWPLPQLEVLTKNESAKEAVNALEEIIKKQVNVKKVSLSDEGIGKEFTLGKLKLDTKLNAELLAEGYSREIVRRIQALRKKAGFVKKDEIKLAIIADKELTKQLEKFIPYIKEKVNAHDLILTERAVNLEHKSKEKIRSKEIGIAFSKV
ncbi:MAG: class I tRNA ligase family protein, partial [Nanoarchaeota archaeon]